MSIRFSDVSVRYGEKDVLKHITLKLPERGTIALQGASGTGKTTFLRVLAGLIHPTAGQVTGLGGKRVTMVFQEDRLLPWYTAYENVLFALPDDRENRERTALDWLERMELSDAIQQYPAALSGGMKRRVAIARALAYGGDVLLLDEPFNGLDDALRVRVAAHIRDAAPLTVLVTHDQAEAALLGARTIELSDISR
jgi:ABC-type nitrate/sulfonate/bicarbonate transport system ATPase subunit